ncbi:MAG TPA: PsbP-related protein [Methanobacterium sp.]|jgi:hypothetical protein|nr:PsbP-related protein [Methanobacterium sp.]
MGKFCPECGKENVNSAEFCENCGEQLPKSATVSAASDIPSTKPKGGWWSQQSTGVKAGIALGGLCCLGLIVVVFFFGLFIPDLSTMNTTTSDSTMDSTTSLSKTFSKDGITFKYPGDWETKKNRPTTDNSQNIGILASPDGFGVFVYKEVIPAGETSTVKEAYEGTKKNFKEDPYTLEFISESQRSVNGIKAYQMIFTGKGENQTNKIQYLVLGEDDEIIYYLQFMDKESSFNSNKAVIEEIINTIKIE